jgi:hypothetical protein
MSISNAPVSGEGFYTDSGGFTCLWMETPDPVAMYGLAVYLSSAPYGSLDPDQQWYCAIYRAGGFLSAAVYGRTAALALKRAMRLHRYHESLFAAQRESYR